MEFPSMKIISVSRRTDIPAFYGPWFMNRLQEGFVEYRKPSNGERRFVDLKPDHVAAFVFWSKNYQPFLQYLPLLESYGYLFYFHYTITGLPKAFREHVPAWEESVKTFHKLASRYGRDRVIWRFDPIIISQQTDPAFHEEMFSKIASALEGAVSQCIFSFTSYGFNDVIKGNTDYREFMWNFKETADEENIQLYELTRDKKIKLSRRLAAIAKQHGIIPSACGNDFLIGDNVKKAHCIDRDLLMTLFPDESRRFASRNGSGKECGCIENHDIGAYDTCPHGCFYCYANVSPKLSLRNFKSHDKTAVCL